MGSTSLSPCDHELIRRINRQTAAGLVATGRAPHGKLGGAIYAVWPDGRPAVVTRFLGSLADAERTASLISELRDRGLPVPRHELVIDIEGDVTFVQERLPSAPPGPLTPTRIEELVQLNDRFAGALAASPHVPDALAFVETVLTDGQYEALADRGERCRTVVDEILRIAAEGLNGPARDDLVHVDYSAANVLFDDGDRATGVVDWNLGAYRGDRNFALVQTRFDREWFVQSPQANPIETRAAERLDEILIERIDPATLRQYWAQWLRYHLARVTPTTSSVVTDWHLDLAQSRLA